MQDALETLKAVGPRGGDVNNPEYRPEWRRSDFKGDITTLHKFVKDEDATNTGRKNEQPWHRMAAFMLLAGRTNTEIAAAAEVTPMAVTQLRGQRWFQQLLGTLANNAGDEILGVVQSEALESVQRIVTLRDNASSERVQLSAAVTLLEHASGKPVQKTIVASRPSTLSPQEEYQQIQDELRSLESPPPADT